MSRTCDRSQEGFTLIELLVVLAVLSLLAGLVGPLVFRNVGDARQQAAETQIGLFGMALDTYRLDNGTYPTTEQGLSALWAIPTEDPPPRWRGPYVRRPAPTDPWDRAWVYRSPGSESPVGYDLLTLGRDGVEGGEGEDADIRAWELPS